MQKCPKNAKMSKKFQNVQKDSLKNDKISKK